MVICTKRITASFVIDFRLLLLVSPTVDVLNKLVAPGVVLVGDPSICAEITQWSPGGTENNITSLTTGYPK